MSFTEVTDKMLNADYKLNQVVAYVAFWAVLELGLNLLLYSRRRAVGNVKTEDFVYEIFPYFCEVEWVEIPKSSNKRGGHVVLVQRSND